MRAGSAVSWEEMSPRGDVAVQPAEAPLEGDRCSTLAELRDAIQTCVDMADSVATADQVVARALRLARAFLIAAIDETRPLELTP
jgi:hypothetical protein